MMKPNWEVCWHWSLPYEQTLYWQYQRRSEILQECKGDTLLFVEHQSCVTLGKRGGVIDQLALEKHGIEVHQIKRGGLATWHGPGQLVLYPIFNIQKRKIGIRSWVCILQKSIISLLNTWDLDAYADSHTAGIWVADHKIASIGLEIHKGISIHGCAINITNSLQSFQYIDPCGTRNLNLITLEELLKTRSPIEYSLHQIGRLWSQHFQSALENASQQSSIHCRI